MRKNNWFINKKGDGSTWTVVIVILCLVALIFFIYFAIKSGGIAKTISGKIL